ncbi:hypothetical protein O9992_26880 [Vibrio lentus]|nr:hypothetical protein [Vibrio lentus]
MAARFGEAAVPRTTHCCDTRLSQGSLNFVADTFPEIGNSYLQSESLAANSRSLAPPLSTLSG